MTPLLPISIFFFFNDTATTEIYTLSLHDALPISAGRSRPRVVRRAKRSSGARRLTLDRVTLYRVTRVSVMRDRKSTRLNSSHSQISYAVFCLKKKKSKNYQSQIARASRERLTLSP